MLILNCSSPGRTHHRPQGSCRNSRPSESARSARYLRRCAAYALRADEPFGIWGGLTPRDRTRTHTQLAHNKTLRHLPAA